jgi:hypothetical protein
MRIESTVNLIVGKAPTIEIDPNVKARLVSCCAENDEAVREEAESLQIKVPSDHLSVEMVKTHQARFRDTPPGRHTVSHKTTHNLRHPADTNAAQI